MDGHVERRVRCCWNAILMKVRGVTLSVVEVCGKPTHVLRQARHDPSRLVYLIFLILFLSTLSLFSQSNREKFKNLGKAEKRWVIFHPFIAKKALHYTNLVLQV